MSIVVKCHEKVCYLQLIMNVTLPYFLKTVFFYGFFCCVISCVEKPNEVSSSLVKVAIREVGHQLLLINKDSISIVKPVKKIDDFNYELSFEDQIAIDPDSLHILVKSSFQKATLPSNYLVEVQQCEDMEIAYSYQMNQNIEKGIVPCSGRQLKKECYSIRFHFFDKIATSNKAGTVWVLYVLFVGVLFGTAFFYFKLKRTKSVVIEEISSTSIPIGKYKFYPEQNKLIKNTVTVSLSKKECELLLLFTSKPNEIIKREELTKKVWEDHGVFVGRSLDTYISKLRMKLKEDTSIKLLNIHGVGYKLEIN
ncbi:winged helix-turn-helix domain-containing protein [Flavobacterium sp. J27]|uniref:winged helix-turn-helix domain-containing protein n=1 Tax=Flavobacterium sp. J27 TaxID=2060419 RepID=UPI00102F4457|nr:winged helix-turn-helix domain-containing protein [Flavobacterium sp. J27]